ncbi:site-specific integrase [Metaclostridioides mangenotii]|uniref:tyrosine-type recombinase/integrase n=1 Tax=Metaclostridioides mangenotii TaxID=1540 RepID=UPI0028EDD820|nr:site-specific integrase [Clostridioides mangenotii]
MILKKPIKSIVYKEEIIIAKKRAHGEGHIGKYKDGWRANIMVGYSKDGKLIRKDFYGKTQKEVKDKLDEYKRKMALGSTPEDDKITLEQWYYTWLFEYRSKDLKPKSMERYEGIYRNYIKHSEIGKIKLSQLRATHLQKYYNKLLDIDGKPESTVINLNTRIKPCLSEAERHGLIQKNYCKLVKLPKNNKKKEINVLTQNEQRKFLDAIKGHKLEMLYLMALSTGLRIGELLGLKWTDINLINKSLTVKRTIQRVSEVTRDGRKSSKLIEQEPKTKNSYRTIHIPENILIKLKDYNKEQNLQKIKIRDVFQNNDYVFCNEIGLPIDDKKPGRNLKSILNKINIEPIKFHALRHTYATRLFEAGVSPKTVQVLMGHSDISITMDIYTHVMEDVKIDAVEQLNDIFLL